PALSPTSERRLPEPRESFQQEGPLGSAAFRDARGAKAPGLVPQDHLEGTAKRLTAPGPLAYSVGGVCYPPRGEVRHASQVPLSYLPSDHSRHGRAALCVRSG